MKILLICTGNICRSPMAAAILRRHFDSYRDSESYKVHEIDVTSAGTGAWDGASASEGALLVALENDLDLSNHRARLISRALVNSSDLILTMARHHRTRVNELGGSGKTHLYGEFAGLEGDAAEVSDPYGSSLDVYRDTFQLLDTLAASVVDRILEERSGSSQR